MKEISDKELFLLDMDGTIYIEEKLIDGAFEFIEKLLSKGKKYVFLTNNSSVNKNNYLEKLRKLGIPCKNDSIFSSGMAMGMFLNSEKKGKSVFLVGTKALEEELRSYGVYLTDKDPDILVVGYDRELTYSKLERACYFLDRGAEFLATNPDFLYPIRDKRFLPDCGSICNMLTLATGKTPTFIGKPNPYMVDIISLSLDIPKEKITIIGDRLYTDIATGINSGIQSICVLSGESSLEMIQSSEIIPDIVVDSVRNLTDLL